MHEPPPPDKLREFALLLHNLGYRFQLKGKVEPGVLAKNFPSPGGIFEKLGPADLFFEFIKAAPLLFYSLDCASITSRAMWSIRRGCA